MQLHQLKKFNTKGKKRLGRGNASGHGTFSTRGSKGQKARSGGSKRLKIKGFKQIMAAIPKNRGFKRLTDELLIVNVEALNKKFKEGEKVSPDTLFEKGLIGSKTRRVKILGNGELSVKKLQFENCIYSATAKEKIIGQEGKIIEA